MEECLQVLHPIYIGSVHVRPENKCGSVFIQLAARALLGSLARKLIKRFRLCTWKGHQHRPTRKVCQEIEPKALNFDVLFKHSAWYVCTPLRKVHVPVNKGILFYQLQCKACQKSKSSCSTQQQKQQYSLVSTQCCPPVPRTSPSRRPEATQSFDR